MTAAAAAPFHFGRGAFNSLTMDTIDLEAQLRRTDLRRCELEAVLASLPPASILRADLEGELRQLWHLRRTIADQLRQRAA
jgi:hypothetical protein